MGLKDRRSNIPHGRYSKALVLPASLEKGKESTLAANRLMLVDPRGEISENDLLEFLETHIEPNFWPWIAKKRESSHACIYDISTERCCITELKIFCMSKKSWATET